MKKQIFLLSLSLTIAMTALSQQSPINLFPNGAPGEESKMTQVDDSSGRLVADKTVLRIGDVSEPTITFYPAPAENNSGVTIIVNPGGGYNILAYDLEGTEVCDWFNKKGINCVLVKYRVPRREGLDKHEAPLQDVQRAIAYTRFNAKNWNIDPDKIGIMGFSAGAHLSVMASTSFGSRSYDRIDSCDDVSLRPDFCILIYPAYLDGKDFKLSPEINVTDNTPPTFIVQTQDDSGLLNSSIFYYYALKEAKVPVSMNLYPSGGHGYGLRDTGDWVNEWPNRVVAWMIDGGLL